VRLRSAPLDDVLNELQLVLDDDGGRLARVVRRTATWAYRGPKAAMLAALRLRWRRGAGFPPPAGYPELGNEPFNLTDAELDAEWRRR